MSTENLAQNTLFCICCLERNVPFINLITCTHSEFLTIFEQPEIKPSKQVVCHHCHIMLKKIEQFKLQLSNNFKLLKTQVSNPDSNNQIRNNLKIHKVIIEMPEFDPIQDKITNLETKNSLEHVTEKDNCKSITCKIENSLENENYLGDRICYEDNLTQETNAENITCKAENSIEKENNLRHRICYEENCVSNATCKIENITDENTLVNSICYEDNIGKQINNLECTDTEIQHNIDNTDNSQANDKTYYNKKLKNIETALSIINQNNSTDCNNILGALQSVVSNSLTNILQATDIPNVFNLVANTKDARNEDQMQVVDNEESEPSVSDTTDHMKITTITLTKKELKEERKLIANSELYVTSPHKCKGCLLGFQFRDNFDDHMKRRHTNSQNGVTCSICLQVLPKQSHGAHTTRHYTRYRCGFCGVQFSLYDEAVEHYEIEHPTAMCMRQQSDPKKSSHELPEVCIETHAIATSEAVLPSF